MSIWSQITGLFARRSKMTPDQWWDTFFGGSAKSSTGEIITQLSALRVAAVWACVTIIAEDVAKLPWHVYRRKPNGGKEIVESHPLERLLQRPNGWQNGFEFKEMTMAALLLRRNGYAAILRDWKGTPIGLVPVNPDWVAIFQAPDGSIFYNVARQNMHLMAALRTLPLMIPTDNMLHFRGLSLNSLWGQSAIASGKDAIGLALAQQELAAIFASNGTQLSGTLDVPSRLSDAAYERLKTTWKQHRAGLKNAGETAILEEGTKFTRLTMTSVDAEFMKAREHQVLEIGRYFRVPLHKLLIAERMTSSTMAQAEQEYVNNVVMSWVTRLEEKLSETFELLDDGLFVEFDVSHFLRADILTRYQALRLATGGAGWLQPNEARRGEGLPDDPDGDVLLRPANLVPLGTPIGGGALGSDQTGAPAPGGDGDQAGEPPSDSAPSG